MRQSKFTETWMWEYNEERAHDTLAWVPPATYRTPDHNQKFSFAAVSLTGKRT